MPLEKIESKSSIQMKTSRAVALISLITQAIQFNDYYWISVSEKNKFDIYYKLALIWAFLALLAPYWICYSGLLSIKNSEEKYSAKNCRNDRWYHTFAKMLFLTFLGSLEMLCMQILQAMSETLCFILGKCTGDN